MNTKTITDINGITKEVKLTPNHPDYVAPKEPRYTPGTQEYIMYDFWSRDLAWEDLYPHLPENHTATEPLYERYCVKWSVEMDLYFLKQKKERQMQESYNSNTVTLVLLRGLPGSGKNTLGDNLSNVVISADDYFMVDGKYQFDGSKLGAAHADCLERTKAALRDAPDGGVVVVANTFSQHWEMAPYLYMADNGLPDFMPDLILNTVVDLFDSGLTDEELEERNSHGVPLQGIQRMRSRWEHDWKKGRMTSPFAK
tara:strand:+ start:172 stop:936 length:765 start_codon:yes stop_codon:yes gene_type:complete